MDGKLAFDAHPAFPLRTLSLDKISLRWVVILHEPPIGAMPAPASFVTETRLLLNTDPTLTPEQVMGNLWKELIDRADAPPSSG